MKAVVKRKFTKLKNELEEATAEMEVILQSCTLENKAHIATRMWEKCEDTEGQEAFLAAVNINKGKKFDFNCSLKLPVAGFENSLRINANNAQLVTRE